MIQNEIEKDQGMEKKFVEQNQNIEMIQNEEVNIRLKTVKNERKEKHQKLETVTRELFLDKLFDSIIIVVNGDPYPIIKALFPYLSPSCPFCIFSSYIEILSNCYQKLWEQQAAIALDIFETITRPYQVLPQRTHPKTNVPAGSGYILHGIKIDTDFGKGSLIDYNENFKLTLKKQKTSRTKSNIKKTEEIS